MFFVGFWTGRKLLSEDWTYYYWSFHLRIIKWMLLWLNVKYRVWKIGFWTKSKCTSRKMYCSIVVVSKNNWNSLWKPKISFEIIPSKRSFLLCFHVKAMWVQSDVLSRRLANFLMCCTVILEVAPGWTKQYVYLVWRKLR